MTGFVALVDSEASATVSNCQIEPVMEMDADKRTYQADDVASGEQHEQDEPEKPGPSGRSGQMRGLLSNMNEGREWRTGIPNI
jgi:hypothetical protein